MKVNNLGLRKYRLRLHGFYFRSMDDKGKMSWGMEVEPPEDMDNTDYNIDPRMRIWKSMTGSGQDKKTLKAEEDLDELQHPSTADLLIIQTQNPGSFPVADKPAEPLQKDISMKHNQKPGEDKDDIDHPVFKEVLFADGEVRVHLKPEEDMDGLHHHDVLQPIPHQDDAEAAAPVDVPSQRKHSEPEEDLDHHYHQ